MHHLCTKHGASRAKQFVVLFHAFAPNFTVKAVDFCNRFAGERHRARPNHASCTGMKKSKGKTVRRLCETRDRALNFLVRSMQCGPSEPGRVFGGAPRRTSAMRRRARATRTPGSRAWRPAGRRRSAPARHQGTACARLFGNSFVGSKMVSMGLLSLGFDRWP